MEVILVSKKQKILIIAISFSLSLLLLNYLLPLFSIEGVSAEMRGVALFSSAYGIGSFIKDISDFCMKNFKQ